MSRVGWSWSVGGHGPSLESFIASAMRCWSVFYLRQQLSGRGRRIHCFSHVVWIYALFVSKVGWDWTVGDHCHGFGHAAMRRCGVGLSSICVKDWLGCSSPTVLSIRHPAPTLPHNPPRPFRSFSLSLSSLKAARLPAHSEAHTI